MTDDEREVPAVTLGEGVAVEGVPLAQVSERLMWGIEKSAIDAREGDTVVRTPAGPRELGAMLAEIETTYFATRREFEDAIRAVIGRGPIPTSEHDEADGESNVDGDSTDDETANADDETADADDEFPDHETADANGSTDGRH